MYLVYKLISPSGKFYIGYTSKSLTCRVSKHIEAYKRTIKKGEYLTPFYIALSKYSMELWEKEILFKGFSKEEAHCKERQYIQQLKTQNRKVGYNVAKGGSGGLIGTGQLGKHWKIKDTSNMHGSKTKTEKVLLAYQRRRGHRNYQFKGWYITPWGKFSTIIKAVAVAQEKRKTGQIVVTDGHTLRKYCKNDTALLNFDGRRTPVEWRGCRPCELGFGFEKRIL